MNKNDVLMKGDVVDTVEPKPHYFKKFKDFKSWPIPRSAYFNELKIANKNWKRLLT